MKITLNFSQFCDSWPESRKDQFSYQGKKALFNYLTQLEEDTGEEIEFDPIAICCDFVEYESATEAASEYFEFEGMTFDEDGTELETVDEVEAKAIKFLEERTTLIEIENSDGVIIANF